MKNRIVTLFILISFLFNVCVFDVALGLSAASMCNDLMGIQYKDIGRIKVALEAQLRGFLEGREDGATIEDLKKALETATVKEETVYQAADMQFFFNEAAEVKEGVRVMCRIKDAQGIRTYYVVFALEKNEFGGFQVKGIYSEDEYKKHGELKETLPKRPEKDEKAIARYVQHEKGIDAIIRYAHENGLVDKPAKFILDIKEELPKLLKRLNVEISTPDGLTPIEDREIFIIDRGRLPGEMQVMLMNTTLVDESGKEFRVDCCAHSSNSAIYIFMPESFAYEALAGKGQHEEWVQEMAAETVRWVFYIHLAHEVGVICGLPAAPMVHHTPVPGDLPVPENEIDRRFRALNNADNIKPFVDMGPLKFEPLSLTVADLDKNLLTRDYAAGDQALRAQAILNTLCSTQPKLRKRAAEGFKRMFPHLANEIDAYFACLPVSGKKILEKAKEIGRPVIACNIDNGELSALQIRGLMKAALEADAFIMFEVGPAALKTYADGKPALPEYCAKEAYRLYQETGKSVVYAVHLDHNQISAKDFYGGTMQEKEKALQVAIKRAQLALIQGFTSFATDTSTLTELEKAEVVDRLENVIMTGAEILKVIYDGARELGISVGNEGEVGDIGKEVSTVEEAVTYYKELVSTLVVLSKELGVDFMKEPLIDIIALNIGTSHGYDFDENDRLKPYKPGRINVKRAKEVHQAFKAMGLNIGVALHGFSGTPIEHAKGFVDTGIAKVNINTDWQAIVWKVFEAYYPDAYKELFGLARELARKDPKKGPALVTDNEKYDLEHARNRIMFGFAR
ncbi:MAG: class II fructose-bisphosphate aldolase, partial [Candidatus Omnitrophota bacterium]